MTVRMRHTRAHTGNRRAHHKLEKPALVKDGDGLHMRHRVSPTTGMYKGKQVLNVKTAKAFKIETKAVPAETSKKEAKTKSKK